FVEVEAMRQSRESVRPIRPPLAGRLDLQIVPGGKRPFSGAGHDPNPQIVPGREFVPDRGEFVVRVRVQGIQNFGPVEGDDPQPALILDRAKLMFHQATIESLRSAPIWSLSIFSQSARTSSPC